jgi:hypothetical protein
MTPLSGYRPGRRGRAPGPAGEGFQPRLAVYAGGGSSHSWLWFVELAERLGLHQVAVLDHRQAAGGALAGREALLVSGGDTFGMAEALGPAGARALEGFLREGGLYLGSCAGAYLPLNSSKPPLDLFNWVPAKITNLSRDLPAARELAEKFCTAYGCSWVFHPVREAVELAGRGPGPWGRAGSFPAPLYGGPAMVVSGGCRELARYAGFTESTRFLAEPELARRTLVGRAAVVRAGLGRGRLYLMGPHLEHPRFARANRLIAQTLRQELPQALDRQAEPPPAERLAGAAARRWLRDLQREVSNLRIVACNLEGHPARWRIGRKVYEPAKLRVYAEAAWPRLRRLERLPGLALPAAAAGLVEGWHELAGRARRLHAGLRAGRDMTAPAAELLAGLNRQTARLVETYFANLAGAAPQAAARPRPAARLGGMAR